jgi:hypothetical protein
MLFRLVGRYQYFGETCCPNLQGCVTTMKNKIMILHISTQSTSKILEFNGFDFTIFTIYTTSPNNFLSVFGTCFIEVP